MDASPWPLRSPAIDTQFASLLTDHVQSRDVAIVSDPCPPLAANDEGVLVAVSWHLSEDGAVSDVLVLLHAAARQAPAAPRATAT